ncbi:hypothetical protein YQE_01595, partial [Dendroctonus ponderosae]
MRGKFELYIFEKGSNDMPHAQASTHCRAIRNIFVRGHALHGVRINFKRSSKIASNFPFAQGAKPINWFRNFYIEELQFESGKVF